jgi:hypothetical protein
MTIDGKRVLRVFPRRTSATPTDDLAVVGDPGLFVPECDEVHVSCLFTWDLPEAERLARAWSALRPTFLGGPATGMRGEAFTPGLYLADGYVVTSRGCPNRCWFCSVPGREGHEVREVPIVDGYHVVDDNLLACSDEHVRGVFGMLSRQTRRAEFGGGLEAARLLDWHAAAIVALRPETMFFAYDTPDDWAPLVRAVEALRDHGQAFAGHRVRCYVLCRYPKGREWAADTVEAAEGRMRAVAGLGVMPQAMLYVGPTGKRRTEASWSDFARRWARPEITDGMMRPAAAAAPREDTGLPLDVAWGAP